MAPSVPSDRRYDLCSPHANIADATTMPPWHPSHFHQVESSMRSTLAVPGALSTDPLDSIPSVTPTKALRQLPTPRSIQSFINPQNLVKEPPPARPAWTAINGNSPAELAARSALRLLNGETPQPVPYPKTPTNTIIFHTNYGRAIPDLDVDMNEIEVDEELLEDRTTSLRLAEDWQVDKEDGRVYHISHQPGATYSGTLINDDPDHIDRRALDKIKKLEEAWAEPDRLARSKEQFCLASEYIHHGNPLLLHRTTFVAEGESVVCRRPGCDKALEANTYYLCMGEDTCFCVHCFEMLWNGECTGGLPNRHEDSKASRRDSAVIIQIPQLDGAYDHLRVEQPGLVKSMHAHAFDSPPQSTGTLTQPGLMQSMHACSDEELDPIPSPVCTPKRHAAPVAEDFEDYPDSPSSLGSTDSNGEWRYPPTRFQDLHASIQPGATLSDTDKAVLALWKYVSMDQWRWNAHLARSDVRRAVQAGETTEDGSLGTNTLTSSTTDDEDAVEAYVMTTGLRKKDCQGRDLSVVLKQAAEKQKEQEKK